MPLIGRPAARGAGLSPAPTRGELPVIVLRGDRARISPARGRPLSPPRSEGEPPLLRTPLGLARGQSPRRHRRPFRPRAEGSDRALVWRLLRARARWRAAPGWRRADPRLDRPGPRDLRSAAARRLADGARVGAAPSVAAR